MREMKILTLGTTPYKVVDEEAREQSGSGGGGVPAATEYNRINVRDYGAVGDGVTNDQPAIWDAWLAAKELLLQDIPCELYFPAGTYGILEGGMTFALPSGKGGLRITGAGRETTIIKYLDDWYPHTKYGGYMWYAIHVCSENGVDGDPSTYIHDVNVSGLTVYDPDPCAHAWHPDKGDSAKEETHGVTIGHCQRVSVTDCGFVTVGDEVVDIQSCSDAIVMNNHCVGCPGAGTSGGAITIGDGSDGVVVISNTVNGSAPDEVLENGSVITKANFGIAVESLYAPVRNVVISNNVVSNIHGNGINIAAVNNGAGLYNIHVAYNATCSCDTGIADSGIKLKENVVIESNTFSDCSTGRGINLSGGYPNLIIRNNTIRNTRSHGMYIDGSAAPNTVLLEGNTFENVGELAGFLAGSGCEYDIRDCIIKNTGVVSATGRAAIYNYIGTATVRVYGCRFTGVRQERATEYVNEIENTCIEMVDTDGNRITNRPAIAGNTLQRLVNCRFDGYFSISQDNAIVQGNIITNGEGWMHALTINANGVIVSGNQITQTDKSKSKLPVAENSGKNYNLFMGNVCNAAITTVGAQSVAVNNIDTSVTA